LSYAHHAQRWGSTKTLPPPRNTRVPARVPMYAVTGGHPSRPRGTIDRHPSQPPAATGWGLIPGRHPFPGLLRRPPAWLGALGAFPCGC